MTVAIAITSILLLTMGGALLMTSSTLDPTASQETVAAASDGFSMLNADLTTATVIDSFTASEIRMTVPDRDGDGQPERIQYVWSGTKGDPMRRSYNGGTAAPFVKSIQSLSVATVSRPAAVRTESAEQVLKSCETPTGSTLNIGNLVNSTSFAAQYVRPTLPANAVCWKITKVRLYMKRSMNNSNMLSLSVQTATAALKPSGTALGGTLFTSGSLPINEDWVEYSVIPISSALRTLAPNQGVCIVLADFTGGAALYGTVKNGLNQPYNTHWMTSPGSSAWSTPNDAEDMKFILLGTVTTEDEPG